MSQKNKSSSTNHKIYNLPEKGLESTPSKILFLDYSSQNLRLILHR